MTPRTDPTHRVDETITRTPHAPHDPDETAGQHPTPDPTHPTDLDPTFSSPSLQGRKRGQAPQNPGRRARNTAARATFQAARNRGLVRRHAAKLEHLRAQTITITRDDLASALNFARCPACQRAAELEVSLDPAGRLDWEARTTHTDDCTGGAA